MGGAAPFGQRADGEPRLLRRALLRRRQRPVHHADHLLRLQRHACRWEFKFCCTSFTSPLSPPPPLSHKSLPSRFPQAVCSSRSPAWGRRWRRWKSCRGISCAGRAPRGIPRTRLSAHTTGERASHSRILLHLKVKIMVLLRGFISNFRDFHKKKTPHLCIITI